MKYFYHQGHLLDDMVIVGHLPTSNYYPNQICNDIIIDEKKKIQFVLMGERVSNLFHN